jgi:hypothetical protein
MFHGTCFLDSLIPFVRPYSVLNFVGKYYGVVIKYVKNACKKLSIEVP